MILDSQHFCVPQRRNRVWGLGCMANGDACKASFNEQFLSGLRSLRTNFQFGMDVNFGKPSVEPELKAGRHADLVEQAKKSVPSNNLFIDCPSSRERNAFAEGVLPLLTPSHPVYSTALNRYVQPNEFLQAQGMWPSLFDEEVYAAMLEQGAQDLAGNGFTTTVCQASILAAMTTGAAFGKTLETETRKANMTGGSGVFKRLRGKQQAICPLPPAFGGKKQKTHKKIHRYPYKRKAEGIDSRKMAKGKKEGATIWQKEKV